MWFRTPNVAEMIEKRDVAGLVKALRHKDLAIREAAVEALGQLGDTQAVQPLCSILKEIMTKRDPKDWAANLDTFFQEHFDGTSDQLGRIRVKAAATLAALGDPRAVDPLCDALNDLNPRVGCAAASALAVLGDRRAFEPLSRALRSLAGAHDMSGGVGERIEAFASALGELAGADDVVLLTDICRSMPSTRWTLARAFAKIGGPAVIEPLCEMLNGDLPIRARAACILGELGDPRAIEPLRAALGRCTVGDVSRADVEKALNKLGAST